MPLTCDDGPDGLRGGVKMASRERLRAADELLSPAVEQTVKALDPPESDAAVVALARILAKTVDRMSDSERAAMIGQTAPQVLRVLKELDDRSRRRAAAAPQQGTSNPVREMRRAYAARRAR